MGTWNLAASCEVDTLPLEAISSLKLLLPLFNAILKEPLDSLLLRSGISLSPPQVIDVMRQSLPRVLLLLQVKFCGSGSTTGGRSSRARKFGHETSIRANLGSPALITLLTY